MFLQSWCSSWLLLLGLFFCPRESGFIGILSQCLGYLVLCGGMSFLTPLESSTHRFFSSSGGFSYCIDYVSVVILLFCLKIYSADILLFCLKIYTLFFVSSSGGLSYCVDDVIIVISLFCLKIYSVVACSVHVILLLSTFLVKQFFVLKYN